VPKNKTRTFKRMGYRQVQRKNSRNRKLLIKEQQKWLKDKGYKNVGWNDVINLYNKLQEIQQEENIKSLSLEELFIEADRIGNKYLDSKEINQRNLAIAKELNQIADLVDEQFPDNTVEVIDYAHVSRRKKI
jgi:predicted Rossmann fold nucleotide-binding protein DprA/Smf involved in DNA uptake